MIKTEGKILLLFCNTIAAVLASVILFSLFPSQGKFFPGSFIFFCTAICFLLIFLVKRRIFLFFQRRIEEHAFYRGETLILSNFLNRVRQCYTYEDFFTAIESILEMHGNASVLYIDCKSEYVLYNSSSKLASSEKTIKQLLFNFPDSWKDGIFFLNREFGVQKSEKKAFGVLYSIDGFHFFMLGPSVAYYDSVVHSILFEELKRFQIHAKIMTEMGEIAALSHDWKKLAEMQRFFLPQVLPKCRNLKMASFFKPLVNVSGDYYTAIPISEEKTLLLLGDVSGKGLASALIMGIALNTVNCAENKEDIVSLVYAIDKAIKEMNLMDKYTVLFIGLVDTKQKTLSYINASLADAFIFSRKDGYCSVNQLESNCCILGIIDLEDVVVSKIDLFDGDFIFLSTDGVSEVKNSQGEELGSMPSYLEMLSANSELSPDLYLKNIDTYVRKFSDGKLRDDLTMLALKFSEEKE